MKNEKQTKEQLLKEQRKSENEVKQVKDAHELSENFYKTVFENTKTAIAILDEDNTILLANEEMEKLTGYTRKEIEGGKKWTEFIARKDELERMKEHHRIRLIDPLSAPEKYEFQFVDRQGQIKEILVTASLIPGTKQTLATLLDISDRKRAEEAVEKRIIALTKPFNDIESLAFEDLFNLSDIQNLQDMLAESWGVASLLTRPDGSAITRPSNFTYFCELIRKTDKGLVNCEKSDAELGRRNPSGPIIHKCWSAGLWIAGASITVSGRHIANWLIGQVRNEEQNVEQIIKCAHELGIDEAMFREAFFKVPVMKQEKFEQIAHALFALANQLSDIAYQNIQQARFIADRKKAEKALRESERKYRHLHESMTEAFAKVNMNGCIQEANRAFQNMLGYSEKELCRLTYMDITPEKWHDFERNIIEEQVLREGHSDVYEKEYRRKDGVVFPVEVRTFLVHDVADKQVSMWAIVRDITERKKMEAELNATKDYLTTVFNNVYDAILIHDLNGKVTDVNDKMLEMYKVSREDALGLNIIYDLSVTEEAQEETLSNWNKVMSGENLFFEWKGRRPKDGSIFDVEVFLTKLSLPDGNYILSNVRDISERKRAEKTLEEQRRQLENANKELESFSYSISHDLRAPLRAIDGFSRMILKKQSSKFDEDSLNKFNVIRRNTEMMGQQIDGLLELSRLGRKALVMSSIDTNNLIKEIWEEIQIINPGRKMSLAIKPSPPAYGDRQLIRLVYSNLLSNAVKFTKNRDIALIETGGFNDNSRSVYYVKDNGAGFDMTYADKLFGVFQRLHTAEEFEGTGIGLATIQRIINRHGGRVWAEGKVDEGATFYFSLPASSRN